MGRNEVRQRRKRKKRTHNKSNKKRVNGTGGEDSPETRKRKRDASCSTVVEKRVRSSDSLQNGETDEDLMNKPCCSKSLSREFDADDEDDEVEISSDTTSTSSSSSDDEEEESDEKVDPTDLAEDAALGNENEACNNAEEAAGGSVNAAIFVAAAAAREEPIDPIPINMQDPAVDIIGYHQQFFYRLYGPNEVNVRIVRINDGQRGRAGNVMFHIRNAVVNRRAAPVGLTRMRYLSLRGYNKVTDVSLQSLKHLFLDLLDVTMTQVTASGVRAFLQSNPNCRVIHETACKCGPKLHF